MMPRGRWRRDPIGLDLAFARTILPLNESRLAVGRQDDVGHLVKLTDIRAALPRRIQQNLVVLGASHLKSMVEHPRRRLGSREIE